MAEPFIGEIFAFAGNFAPQGYVLCQGQLLSINTYSSLYALLGTTYGGDGNTTFGVPDLRGRLINGAGTGTGLSPMNPGQKAGVENVTLTTGQMATHSHFANAVAVKGTSSSPAGNLPAVNNVPATGAPLNSYAPASAGTAVALAPMVGLTGQNTPVATASPYTCINYIMATEGIYPSQS